MDEAALRRGADSANARWDNHVAILTGDFLFAKSSELTAALGPEAVRIQAPTFARLVEGQILETVPPRRGGGPAAALPRGGRRQDRLADRHRRAVRRPLRRRVPRDRGGAAAYGEIVGCAFQLSDDILDIASDSGESGKTPGTDLREGVPTLPVLMARASQDPADARLHELLDADLTDDATHAEALALLRAHPALEEARSYVVARAHEAKALLGVLSRGPGPRGAGGVRRRGRGPHRLTPLVPRRS